ncbi:hypothetical protein DRE_06449 [Drechslerella stenobrocha 248]|uniref:Uncharacterized protein n=1 Tax=Drechslerella stenobrocha 248 TaxID=1043628 RepID=W7HLC7_9PEZI|nr:hypothetical protein DRE_06449 [Drechslerella stenobrocha 248]
MAPQNPVLSSTQDLGQLPVQANGVYTALPELDVNRPQPTSTLARPAPKQSGPRHSLLKSIAIKSIGARLYIASPASNKGSSPMAPGPISYGCNSASPRVFQWHKTQTFEWGSTFIFRPPSRYLPIRSDGTSATTLIPNIEFAILNRIADHFYRIIVQDNREQPEYAKINTWTLNAQSVEREETIDSNVLYYGLQIRIINGVHSLLQTILTIFVVAYAKSRKGQHSEITSHIDRRREIIMLLEYAQRIALLRARLCNKLESRRRRNVVLFIINRQQPPGTHDDDNTDRIKQVLDDMVEGLDTIAEILETLQTMAVKGLVGELKSNPRTEISTTNQYQNGNKRWRGNGVWYCPSVSTPANSSFSTFSDRLDSDIMGTSV